ncbi:hypothetical protein chiPu_0003378 [Chiloscyllium punctatum]|uniref:SHSP domain-containing protein n=1 Tax=Chiloscyllium punctatum TaxID=137246 RepID=A0A401S3I0_CHIPU|nr:hypothetical protein [Chiloscyllium punctatum]
MQNISSPDPSASALRADHDTNETDEDSEKDENLQATEKEQKDQAGVGPNKFSISLDVGDISPEEVTVKIREGILSVSGQHVQNKGKGFSFQGFSEEFAIPPTVDSKTLVATIVDGKRMQIEGHYRSVPVDASTQKPVDDLGEGTKIQKAKKRAFPISGGNSFKDNTTFRAPESKRFCAGVSDSAGNSTLPGGRPTSPMYCNSRVQCNINKSALDRNDGRDQASSKKRKSGKAPLFRSSKPSTPTLSLTISEASTGSPTISRTFAPNTTINKQFAPSAVNKVSQPVNTVPIHSSKNTSGPPPKPTQASARSKHVVLTPTSAKRSDDNPLIPNPWSTWTKNDFEPIISPLANDGAKAPGQSTEGGTRRSLKTRNPTPGPRGPRNKQFPSSKS